MKRLFAVPLALAAVLAGGATRIVQDQCGPFTDVTPGFCPYILEIYYLGITVGTSPTTFSPDEPLTRGQGAVFIAKGVNQTLARSSRRAALGQWWTTTPHYDIGLGTTSIPFVAHVVSDGTDIWAAGGSAVYRVRASDGRLLETWSGPSLATAALVAMGRVFVSSHDPSGGTLFMLDPSQPAGPMTAVATIGDFSYGIAFDGSRIWTTDSDGSISIVTPAPAPPWPVTTITAGFDHPYGVLYDGANVWVTDTTADTLLRLDPNGAVMQTVVVGSNPEHPVFDGANIWVPNIFGNSISVVQASTGVVLTTITGTSTPFRAAFDGQRILVTSYFENTVSLWRAADFTPLGTFSTGFNSDPGNACSDGVNFWIALGVAGKLARF